MVKFILKRIGTMIIAMFMIILITFTLMHSIPGGPFTNTKGVPEEVTQAMEAKYGLDQPMPVQFVKYLGSLLHGDCNLVRRTEKGRLRRRGWGLRWEKAQKGGKGTNLRGFFED